MESDSEEGGTAIFKRENTYVSLIVLCFGRASRSGVNIGTEKEKTKTR